jgi:ABC-2 type transport system permease protein
MQAHVQTEEALKRPYVSPLAFKLAKYSAIGKVTIRNNLAYLYDFLIRSFFLLVILYIFVQLWSVTFKGVGTGSIAGYSFEQIIWYLIFAEALIMATPRLTEKIEDEVKKGDIGYQLTRPMSYLLFHYFSYLGEALVRMGVNLVVGGMLGLSLFGLPHFGWGWLGFVLVVLGALTINYLMSMMLALCAFWVEETRGLEFVYQKLLFTIGGMMLPLEVFPDKMRAICEWLPFQTVVYFPAKMAVRFDWGQLGQMILIEIAWGVVLALVLTAIYRKGVRKLNVNGG